jgi:predicted RNA-binding Zn ribbon-like protein
MPTELQFKWCGGRLSLNFVATVGKWHTSAFDRVSEPADLARWFRDAGLVDELIRIEPQELAWARELRSALWRMFCGGPCGADARVVNQWTSVPLAGPHLEVLGGRVRLTTSVEDVRGLLGLIARDAAELLGGSLAERVRQCADPECTLLFLDESRAGSRRWCSMEECGARSKMSAYRKRLTPDNADGQRQP